MYLPRCHGPLLRGLNLPWAEVLCGGARREHGPGEIIHQMGDAVDTLHYVVDGHVVAKAVTPDGVERYVLGFLPGSMFGQSPFFNRAPAETLFVSVRRTVTVAFSREFVYGRIPHTHPHLLLNLLESDAYRHRVFGRHIADATLRDLETRLCRFLLHLVTEAAEPSVGRVAAGSHLVDGMRGDVGPHDVCREADTPAHGEDAPVRGAAERHPAARERATDRVDMACENVADGVDADGASLHGLPARMAEGPRAGRGGARAVIRTLREGEARECTPVRSGIFTHPGLTHEDVARYLGLHRVTVSNLLGGLRRAGVLGAFNRRHIEICDGAALALLAGMTPGMGDAPPEGMPE